MRLARQPLAPAVLGGAFLAALGCLAAAPPAAAAPLAGRLGAAAARPAVPAPARASPPRRGPSDGTPEGGRPPQADGGQASGEQGAGEAGAAAGVSGEADFLAGNGLSSPLCRQPSIGGAAVSANCASSGFAAAGQPIDHYAFDVHIDVGFGQLLSYAETIIQDAAQWAWLLLVGLVRALIVMLEWCYALNLLGGAVLREVASALRHSESGFTAPLLAAALAAASMLAVYHGLLRRRVAQTLGQALVMLVMMASGLWTILDPGATVGAVGAWVDQASVGTLAVAAAGAPGHPYRTLAASMQRLFGALLSGPWCYMEFGAVRWCRDPALLDPRLEAAARKIAGEERALAWRRYPDGPAHAALVDSARLLEAARTNGALFLALPANGLERNSINEAGSLLSVLCGGSTEATRCSGASAAQAEFRTQRGTLPRVLGLILIWAGALGALLLLGWVVLRLLAAAVLALCLLLLGPVAVLAPALGEGGRGLFRSWSMRLVGALTAKLVYSLLLGVMLTMLDLLSGLAALGWWVQWCLLSGLWWIVFRHRHELLGMMRVGEAAPWSRLTRPVADPLGRLQRLRNRRPERRRAPLPGRTPRLPAPTVPSPTSGEPRHPGRQDAAGERLAPAHVQAAAVLEREAQLAATSVAGAAATEERIAAMRARLARVRAEQAAMEQAARERLARRRAAGDRPGGTGAGTPGRGTGALEPAGAQAPGPELRRARRLAFRAAGIERQIVTERDALAEDRRVFAESRDARRRGGQPYAATALRERARFYERQAALPARGRRDAEGNRRDYRRLAGLAGHSERAWDELSAERKRRAMLTIDRELGGLTAVAAPARDVGARGQPSGGAAARPTDLYASLERSLSAEGAGGLGSPPEAPSAPSPGSRTKSRGEQSPAAARRRRQLGG